MSRPASLLNYLLCVVAALVWRIAAVEAQVLGFSDSATGYGVWTQLQLEGQGGPGLRFEIRAPATAGWVGFGFGENMASGDLMIGWVDASSRNVVLTKKTGASGPNVQDAAVQDLILLQGSGIVNNQLVVNIFRPFTSMPPLPPTKFLWAMGSTNPQSPTAAGASLTYHGTTRGRFESNFVITGAEGNPSNIPTQPAGSAQIGQLASEVSTPGGASNRTSNLVSDSPTGSTPAGAASSPTATSKPAPPSDPVNPLTIPFIAIGLSAVGMIIFNFSVFMRRRNKS
ncbi:hypothetical protein HK102_001296 [Quaeritorhiza haematococci]|nr:hypothetical protein HK102_001296 [Quaeritorhiza haematococci]